MSFLNSRLRKKCLTNRVLKIPLRPGGSSRFSGSLRIRRIFRNARHLIIVGADTRSNAKLTSLKSRTSAIVGASRTGTYYSIHDFNRSEVSQNRGQRASELLAS